MGACHALPQQQDQYEVAFKCQKTCDRCHGMFICILFISNIFDKIKKKIQQENFEILIDWLLSVLRRIGNISAIKRWTI